MFVIMNSIVQILSVLGDTESRLQYLYCITVIVKISRLSEVQLTVIDSEMYNIYELGEIMTLNQCYTNFVECCKVSRFRPLHYWEYLFSSLR